jgi:putative transposase
MAVCSTAALAPRHRYDPNLRNAVCATADPLLFDGIPVNTQRTWIRRGAVHVVSFEPDTSQLLVRIRRLERANSTLRNIVRLLLALIRAFDITLDGKRVPDAAAKRILMTAVARATVAMPRKHALRVLGLTPSRLAQWQGAAVQCRLDDRPSCPRSRPTRLSARELLAMKQLATDLTYSHLPTRALAQFAQRMDLVHVSVGTWYRTLRRQGWRRPRFRIHPRAPTIGLRASAVGQYLHIDITIIILLDGAKAYVQAILDNFSRVILAYAVSYTKTAAETAGLIRQARAALGATEGPVTLIADDGGENARENSHVASALSDTAVALLVAQVDVFSSNSMIERFWSSLKHNFLYDQRLSSITALRRFVDFYVHEHNHVIPHDAFDGQTPVEVFSSTASELTALLAHKRADARARRIDENRRIHCGVCTAEQAPPRSVP